MKRSAAWLACGWLMSMAGGAAADTRADEVLAEMGGEAFARHCASCHGVDGKGRGPAAGALKTPPADLTRIAARRDGKFDEGEVARFIDGRFDVPAHGDREMPVWGQRMASAIPDAGLSEEVVRGRIYVLVEYLKSIQEK